MPHAEFVKANGASHMVHHEGPDWLARTIVDWLAKTLVPGLAAVSHDEKNA